VVRASVTAEPACSWSGYPDLIVLQKLYRYLSGVTVIVPTSYGKKTSGSLLKFDTTTSENASVEPGVRVELAVRCPHRRRTVSTNSIKLNMTVFSLRFLQFFFRDSGSDCITLLEGLSPGYRIFCTKPDQSCQTGYHHHDSPGI